MIKELDIQLKIVQRRQFIDLTQSLPIYCCETNVNKKCQTKHYHSHSHQLTN